MMSPGLAFLLIIVAGLMQGSYFLGLKYIGSWKWENIWALYAVFALIIMPIGLAFATVPHLSDVLSLAPRSDITRLFLYGVAWGVGSVLSGLGVDRLGLAMGVSVLIGVQAVIGSFVPLVANTPELVLQRKGLMVIAAVITLLVGLALVAFAGRERDRSRQVAETSSPQSGFVVGMLICLFSGIFSAMLNLGFAFSGSVSKASVALGASESSALNAVWAIALFGGFIPNVIYTGYLLTKNRTWSNYALPRTSLSWLVGFMMALLWYGGIILYGRGATGMGQVGVVIGWPLFMAIIILTSSLWGFITGEWTTANARAKGFMKAGLAVLIVASALLGVANRF